MSVRAAELADLAQVAVIHKTRFGDHLLGNYSVRFLSIFYQGFLGRSTFLVHETGSGVDGFVVGGEANQVEACGPMFVRAHWLRCLGETILRPRVWSAATRRGLHLVTAKSAGQRETGGTVCTSFSLLSIAVAREAAGTGVAHLLVDGFEQAIRARTTEYWLSVSKGNSRAIQFYENTGFQVQGADGDCLRLRKVLHHASEAE
jgi:ribosomal protein S18 acetylase RimI-like enzyme